MSRPASSPARLAVSDVRVRAVLAGLLLGTLAQALATQRPGDAFALAMALVMVAAGAASFVLHALAAAPARGGASGPMARVRVWLTALGLGVVAGMQGTALLGG